MPTVLDTSSLIRFFTRDIEEKAAKVKVLLKSGKVTIPDVVFPELEYVLTSEYNCTRDTLIRFYQFLTSQDNIHVSSGVKRAVILFTSTDLDMADCIIAAQSLGGTLASFDKELLRVTGVQPYWK